MTILVIEDDKWLGELYQDVLEKAGYTVVIAPDAQAGLDALDDTIVHTIILDLMLPGVNGIALLHEIRSHPDLCAIPIIINSAVSPAHCGVTAEDWRAYGVVEYIPKLATKPQALVRAVRGAVRETV